jgi:hypothetical protein
MHPIVWDMLQEGKIRLATLPDGALLMAQPYSQPLEPTRWTDEVGPEIEFEITIESVSECEHIDKVVLARDRHTGEMLYSVPTAPAYVEYGTLTGNFDEEIVKRMERTVAIIEAYRAWIPGIVGRFEHATREAGQKILRQRNTFEAQMHAE